METMKIFTISSLTHTHIYPQTHLSLRVLQFLLLLLHLHLKHLLHLCLHLLHLHHVLPALLLHLGQGAPVDQSKERGQIFLKGNLSCYI